MFTEVGICECLIAVIAMVILTAKMSNYFDRKNGICNNANEISDELNNKTKENKMDVGIGDIVKLKSGGPRMTVKLTCGYQQPYDQTKGNVLCSWFAESGGLITWKFKEGCFHRDQLTVIAKTAKE